MQKWQSGERLSDQDWQTIQRALDREFTASERQAVQAWQTGERISAQEWQTLERVSGQQFTTAEREAVNAWRTGERVGTQAFQARENSFLRKHQLAMAQGGWRAQLYSTAMSSYVAILASDSADVDKAAAIDRLFAWVNEGGLFINGDTGGDEDDDT